MTLTSLAKSRSRLAKFGTSLVESGEWNVASLLGESLVTTRFNTEPTRLDESS